MGDVGSYAEHTNAVFKEEMGWIKPSEMLTITESGTYTISPLEGTISVSGKKPARSIKAAKIQVGENFYPIYLEYRKAIGIDSYLNNFEISSNQNGLFILLSWFSDGAVSSSLLDADSYGLGWPEDLKTATLNSETIFTYTQNIFSDESLGITIGPILDVTPEKITFNVSLTPLPSFCGKTWTRINTPEFSKISFADSNNGLAIGEYHLLYRTTDGGRTWAQQQNTGYSRYIQFIDQNNGWVVGYNNFYRTTDGGQTWTTIDTPLLDKISFVDSNNGWAIGGGNIYHTTNGGLTWMQQFSNEDEYYYNIQFINQNNGWVVGYDTFSHTTDGGQTWTEIINTHSLFKISFVDSNNGWATGFNDAVFMPTIYHTTDGGQTWTQQISNGEFYYSDVQFINQQNGWATGLNNLFHTTDGGQTWIKQDGIFKLDYFLGEISVIDENHIWIKSNKKLYCIGTTIPLPSVDQPLY